MEQWRQETVSIDRKAAWALVCLRDKRQETSGAEAIYATQVARGRPGDRGRGRDGWTSDTVKRQETRGVMLQWVRARVRVRVHKHKQKSESPMRAREIGKAGT